MNIGYLDPSRREGLDKKIETTFGSIYRDYCKDPFLHSLRTRVRNRVAHVLLGIGTKAFVLGIDMRITMRAFSMDFFGDPNPFPPFPVPVCSSS